MTMPVYEFIGKDGKPYREHLGPHQVPLEGEVTAAKLNEELAYAVAYAAGHGLPLQILFRRPQCNAWKGVVETIEHYADRYADTSLNLGKGGIHAYSAVLLAGRFVTTCPEFARITLPVPCHDSLVQMFAAKIGMSISATKALMHAHCRRENPLTAQQAEGLGLLVTRSK